MLGLPSLIARLWEDALGLARAEIQLLKSRAVDKLRRSRTAIILLAAALVLAFAGIIGLVVGLVLALVPLVGAVLAGVIVLAACLAIAGLLAWLAIRQFSAPTPDPALPEIAS